MKKQLLSGILGASLAGFGLVGTLPQPAQACNILLTGIRCIRPIGGSSGGSRRSGGGMGGRSPQPDYSDLGYDSYETDDDDDSLVLPPAGSTGGYLTGITTIEDFYRVNGRMPTIGEALNIPGVKPSGNGCVWQGNSSYCGLK